MGMIYTCEDCGNEARITGDHPAKAKCTCGGWLKAPGFKTKEPYLKLHKYLVRDPAGRPKYEFFFDKPLTKDEEKILQEHAEEMFEIFKNFVDINVVKY